MANNDQTQTLDPDQMSEQELKEKIADLKQQIEAKERFIEERDEFIDSELKVAIDAYKEAFPQLKEEIEKAEAEEEHLEQQPEVSKRKTSASETKSETPKESVKEKTEITSKEPSTEDRLKSIREALYTTAMEHDESAQSNLSEQTKKDVSELREKIWNLEKKKREATDRGSAGDKMRAIREKAGGITKTEEKFGQGVSSSAVEQKVEDIEKNPQTKKWEHSGTRKEIVEMLREKSKEE